MVSLRIYLAFALSLCVFQPAQAADTESPVDKWFASQGKIHTWSAPFTQTRSLKALTQPLTASGKVWFVAPNQFRWELGEPAQTVAVRQPEQMLVIYPLLKRAERFSLVGNATGPWKDALTLLETGFPQSREDLESHFKIMSEKEVNGIYEMMLQPKASAAKRMMPQIKIGFGLADYSLRMTELTFADGSTLRNDFGKAEVNGEVKADLFQPTLGADFTITEPLKKR